jgi:hypothetical protein
LDHVHADRAAYEAATALIDSFGDYAADEASARAEKSRSLGNIVHFCRWRQIERAITLLSCERSVGSVH